MVAPFRNTSGDIPPRNTSRSQMGTLLGQTGDTPGTAETDFGQTDFGHPYFPTLAKSDFGQTDFGQKNLTDFGHPYLTDFGQTDFGQL